jgi:hypothetical protein
MTAALLKPAPASADAKYRTVIVQGDLVHTIDSDLGVRRFYVRNLTSKTTFADSPGVVQSFHVIWQRPSLRELLMEILLGCRIEHFEYTRTFLTDVMPAEVTSSEVLYNFPVDVRGVVM